MGRERLAISGMLAGVGLLCAVPGARVRGAEAPVTYSRQIAPILYKNCSTCHHAGGAGPFALTSYAEARRWGGVMEEATRTRYMPPWLPEEGHVAFAGDRRLADEDVALIKRWVEGGMPEGDRAEAPKEPVYTSEWQLGPPDLMLETDAAIAVPASGTDIYRNMILPVTLGGTRWIRAMEIKPGSPQVVHHANLIVDRTASLRRLHPADWKKGIPGMDITVDSGDQFDPDSHFLEWKPDSSALVEPAGMPWRLDPGNDLVLNMHLKPTGKPEAVRARIGLYFAREPATVFPMLLQLEHDGAIDIPSGDKDFAVEDKLTLPEDVDLLAIYPHAHYLGKRLEGYALLPDGTRRELIVIAAWDIDRQAIYRLARPMFLPKGTVVGMRFAYDNSAANPKNPNAPPIRVKAGNRSADEMGHLWLQVLPRAVAGKDGDARGPLMRAWMENQLRKNPADDTALFNLASLDLAGGDAAAAVSLYRRASSVKPDDVRITTALGSAMSRTGDWQGARTQFQAAVRQDGSYADARFDLGLIDLQHEEFAEAEAQFRVLLAVHPDDATAHAGLGSALLARERGAEAEAEYRTALRLDAGNFDALYNLATIEAGSGRAAEAIGHLQAAAKLRPEDADTHRGLAELEAQAGQFAEALVEAKAVVALDPAQAADWNTLGVLHVRAGDRAAAREDFGRALKLDPANEMARANLARL